MSGYTGNRPDFSRNRDVQKCVSIQRTGLSLPGLGPEVSA
jgi:hypothetical protein